MIKHPLRHQIKISFLKHQFSAYTWLILIFLLVLYGLLKLGLWQLDRQQEKTKLLQSIEDIQSSQPLNLNVTYQEVKDYQPVYFEGKALNSPTVLIANEPLDGRDGYHVLNLLRLDSGIEVWVNRGWIAALPDRRNLPVLPELNEQWSGTGEVYFSKGKPILYDHALEQRNERIWVLQGRDFSLLKDIANSGQSTRLPFIIRISENTDNGLQQRWQYVSMSPSKHLAYAIQWFGLALALTVIVLIISITKKES